MSQERISALERTIQACEQRARKDAKNCKGRLADLREGMADGYEASARIVRMAEIRWWKLLEELEIAASLQKDEENSQYFECAKLVRAVLEGKEK